MKEDDTEEENEKRGLITVFNDDNFCISFSD